MTYAAAFALAVAALTREQRLYRPGHAIVANWDTKNGPPLPFALRADRDWQERADAIEILNCLLKQVAEGEEHGT